MAYSRRRLKKKYSMFWLTDDVAVLVAQSLDFRSYVRLLCTCRLARTSLSPNRASVVFPHAIRRIDALIRKERVATPDPEFVFERSIGNVLVYATPFVHGGRKKSYFQILVNDLDETKPTTIIVVVNRRWFFRYGAGEEASVPLNSVTASITPSLERPLFAGTVDVRRVELDQWGDETVVSTAACDYTDGFHQLVRTLVRTVCPLT
jgi:hypothetical protein